MNINCMFCIRRKMCSEAIKKVYKKRNSCPAKMFKFIADKPRTSCGIF